MIKSFFSVFLESPNSFEGQEKDERVLRLLRRHPLTILVALVAFVLISIIPIVVGLAYGAYIAEHGWLDLLLLLSGIFYMGLWLASFQILTMYTLNTLIITDRRIINNNQKGFFNREISELHSNRIQDVSSHTSGLIETILKFGKITVQTAASERQFVINQIPNPDQVKDIIMQMARSRNLGTRSTDTR